MVTKDILVVLVLYNCRIEASAAFYSLNRALEKSNGKLDLLIYDNSPHPITSEREFDISNFHITYINNPSNPGVSKAYNEGWQLARNMGKKYLLLSDQDTSYPDNAIEMYCAQAEKEYWLSAPILLSGLGIVSPCGYKWGRGWILDNCPAGKISLRNRSVLNSGLLIKLDILDSVGGYNEQIPLDFSDHEWITRVKKVLPTIHVMNLVCHHELSAEETNKEKVLIRFNHYLSGSRELQKVESSLALRFLAFARGLKLSIRFRTFAFLHALWQQKHE